MIRPKRDRFTTGFTTLSDRLDPTPPPSETPGGEVVRVKSSRNDTEAQKLLSDAKEYAHSLGEDDSLIESLVRSALDRAERSFGLMLTAGTVTADIRGPARTVDLPRRPANTLTSIATVEEGTERSRDLSEFWLEGSELHSGVAVAGSAELIRVEYEAGWSHGDMPASGKQAIRRAVTTEYDHRSDVQTGTSVSELPESAKTRLRELTQTIR
jgi:hypothetical protein